MRSCISRPGTVRFPLAAVLAITFATTGCSGRLPLAPESSSGAGIPRDGAPAAHGRYRNAVVVTLDGSTDATALAGDYGATLEEVDWGVAGLLPADGQSSDDLVDQLSDDPRVVTAEADIPVETAETRQESFAFDDGYGTAATFAGQPALSALGAVLAHQYSTGFGVRVAILDTGADGTHPALAGRIEQAWDFVDGDPDATEAGDGVDSDYDGRVDEALGHGTHVAGIVALVAPDARLLVARVLDDDGHGTMLDVAQAVRWAVARGARVINLSLGGLKKSDAVQLALKEAYDAGVVCVAAAGNWGSLEPEEFPAISRYALAVAALDDAGWAAPFTSHGDYVDISAPGVAIRSAYVNGGYAQWSGSSMATSFVSGAAALLLALHPDWAQGKTLERLSLSARDLSQLNPGWDSYLGAGGLDLGTALWAETLIEDVVTEVEER